MKLFAKILPVILGMAFMLPAQGVAKEGASLRLLFLGSSSTYYHDLPSQVADWLTDYAKIETKSDLAGRSGTGVHIYLRQDFKAEYGLQKGQTVREKIANGNYDYVILQIPTDYLAGQAGNDSEAFDRAIDTYAKAIRQAGSTPLLYEQGWGEGPLFEKGDKMIRAAAQRNAIDIIPCRSAWRRVRKEHPMIELHDLPDRTHPGRIGTYLNLCCFYAALTGESPQGLEVREVRYWPFVMKDGKRKRNRDSSFYQVNDDLAQYLQKVAWDAGQNTQRDLDALNY